ncbi:hypothetical protein [Nesterenkonia pannonica]|uniref:hypothetical protein n=1 Tax=Nesterenkonia pannonica TaxID=1548602 RepID=UPI002164B3F6|nr:hypothetical protein [Nesterenkonia pannonica]
MPAQSVLASPQTLSRRQLSVQRGRDVTAETLAPQVRRGTGSGTHEDLAEGQSLFDVGAQGGEFDEMPARPSEDRLGLFVVLTALTGVSLIGSRELLTAGSLGGGASLPVSVSIAETWQHATSFLAADSWANGPRPTLSRQSCCSFRWCPWDMPPASCSGSSFSAPR